MSAHQDEASFSDTEPFSAGTRQRFDQEHAPGARQNEQESNSRVGDILRIVPSNNTAKRAFDVLAKRKLDKTLTEHHSQYIVITHKGLLDGNTAYQPRASDETTGEEESSEESRSEKEILHGYFRIDFDCAHVREDVQFVIGRGSGKRFGLTRDVDILLAAGHKEFTKGLKAAHAYLKIHPISGAWLLQAGEDSLPLAKTQRSRLDGPTSLESSEAVIAMFNEECLLQKEYRPLSRPRNDLRINDMHYDVVFVIIDPVREAAYRKERDHALQAAGLKIPHTAISGIPFDVDGKTRTAVFRRGLGSGTFGTIFEGFDKTTGDLRAVKKIHLKSFHKRFSVQDEIQANETLSGLEGIVTLYECSNSEGAMGTNADTYPFDVFLVQERGVAFNKYAWMDAYPVDWKLRAILLRQLLRGLMAIHQHGWMHRDITPMNILYFEHEPKHTGFCGFGKIWYEKTDTSTSLAAWQYLPPEIQKTLRNTYDQKIDVWMLGFAIIHSWYPRIIEGLAPRKNDDYQSICSRLGAEKQSGLAGLLLKMVSWYAKDRPSAEQAVGDPCLKNAFHMQPEPVKSSDRKRLQA